MKTIKAITAVVLFTGFTSLSFAGPGIDYWTRTKQAEKNQVQAKAKAEMQTKAQAAPQVASCAACSCAAMKKS